MVIFTIPIVDRGNYLKKKAGDISMTLHRKYHLNFAFILSYLLFTGAVVSTDIKATNKLDGYQLCLQFYF